MSSGSGDGPNAPSRLCLRLYVAGDAANSLAALANLRGVLAAHPERLFDLEIIDVFEDPDRALRDGILVTPMLVKIAPPPERRILGNLRDLGALLGVLGLEASDA